MIKNNISKATYLLMKLVMLFIGTIILGIYMIYVPYIAYFKKVEFPLENNLIEKTVYKGEIDCKNKKVTGKIKGSEIRKLTLLSSIDCYSLFSAQKLSLRLYEEKNFLFPEKKRWIIYEINAGVGLTTFNKNYTYNKLKVRYEEEEKETRTIARIMFPTISFICLVIIIFHLYKRKILSKSKNSLYTTGKISELPSKSKKHPYSKSPPSSQTNSM